MQQQLSYGVPPPSTRLPVQLLGVNQVPSTGLIPMGIGRAFSDRLMSTNMTSDMTDVGPMIGQLPVTPWNMTGKSLPMNQGDAVFCHRSSEESSHTLVPLYHLNHILRHRFEQNRGNRSGDFITLSRFIKNHGEAVLCEYRRMLKYSASDQALKKAFGNKLPDLRNAYNIAIEREYASTTLVGVEENWNFYGFHQTSLGVPGFKDDPVRGFVAATTHGLAIHGSTPGIRNCWGDKNDAPAMSQLYFAVVREGKSGPYVIKPISILPQERPAELRVKDQIGATLTSTPMFVGHMALNDAEELSQHRLRTCLGLEGGEVVEIRRYHAQLPSCVVDTRVK